MSTWCNLLETEMAAGSKWGGFGLGDGRKRYLAENTADVDGGNKGNDEGYSGREVALRLLLSESTLWFWARSRCTTELST